MCPLERPQTEPLLLVHLYFVCRMQARIMHGVVSIHFIARLVCSYSACSTDMLLLFVTGLQPNGRVRLLASAAHDVAAVRSARDMPGLAGLEHESQRAAARRRTVGGADVTLPTGSSPLASCAPSRDPMRSCAVRAVFPILHALPMYAGPYTFQRFQTWDGLPMDAFPSAAHALKLLHRLAADRGIAAIMAKHKWRCVAMCARSFRS